MPTQSWNDYLEKRATERTPEEQAAFDIASKHFRAIADDLDARCDTQDGED